MVKGIPWDRSTWCSPGCNATEQSIISLALLLHSQAWTQGLILVMGKEWIDPGLELSTQQRYALFNTVKDTETRGKTKESAQET